MSIAIALGYFVALVGVIWFAIDSSRIPSMIWYWSGYSRPGWWGAVLLCFVPFGALALVATIAWRFSQARKSLRLAFDDLRQQGRAAREARLVRSPENVA